MLHLSSDKYLALTLKFLQQVKWYPMISSSQLSGSMTSSYLCYWCIRTSKNCLRESRISWGKFFVSSLFPRKIGFLLSKLHNNHSIFTHWRISFRARLRHKYCRLSEHFMCTIACPLCKVTYEWYMLTAFRRFALQNSILRNLRRMSFERIYLFLHMHVTSYTQIMIEFFSHICSQSLLLIENFNIYPLREVDFNETFLIVRPLLEI